MALDIADAITNKEHLVIEAEVGIGKSFAYLVPLIYYYKYFRSPVIIATSTIALQEQLEEDIQKLTKTLKVGNLETIIAKGQTHFICTKRFSHELGKAKKAKEIDAKKILDQIGEVARKGVADRRYFKIPITNEIWNKINIDGYGYHKCGNCPWKERCYYDELRKSLPTFIGIIICNQDLLTIDLLNQESGRRPIINEKAALIVIDEAHNLEGKVRNIRTENYTKSKATNVLHSSTKIMSMLSIDYSKELEIAFESIDLMFEEIGQQIFEQEKHAEEAGDIERFFLKHTLKMDTPMESLFNSLSTINDRIQINMDYNRVSESMKDIAEEIEKLYSPKLQH